MKNFQKNIKNIYGREGEVWLAKLPNLITDLVKHWHLTELKPVANLTYNYIAKGFQKGIPVVLKISYSVELIESEKCALDYFAGEGAIQVLDSHSKDHALLLQQASPGVSLKSLYPQQVERVMDIYLATMCKLHHKTLPQAYQATSVEDWLQVLDIFITDKIPAEYLQKAVLLKNKLLAHPQQKYLLHGDLHHDNILQNGSTWLAIDPKGVIGEAEFELTNFDFISEGELAHPNLGQLLKERINLLAVKSGYSAQRLQDWLFVKLILSAIWHVEDRGNPSASLKLAHCLLDP